MEKQDRKDFAKAMYGLGLMVDKDLSKDAVDVWWQILKEYPIESVRESITHYLKTAKYKRMPMPGELIEHIKGPQIAIEDKAELAWADIMSEIRRIGSYGTPCITDRTSANLMRGRFSWKSLCAMTERELAFTRKEFINVYNARSKEHEHLAIDAPEKLKALANNLTEVL